MKTRCIMCHREFACLEYRMWCSVGCNADWARDEPTYAERCERPEMVESHPSISLDGTD